MLGCSLKRGGGWGQQCDHGGAQRLALRGGEEEGRVERDHRKRGGTTVDLTQCRQRVLDVHEIASTRSPAEAACGPRYRYKPSAPYPPQPPASNPSLQSPGGRCPPSRRLCVWKVWPSGPYVWKADPTPHPVGDEELVLCLGAHGVHLGRDDVEVDVLQHTHLQGGGVAEGAKG